MDEWSHPFTYDPMTGRKLEKRDYPILPYHGIGGSDWGTYAFLETGPYFAVLMEINGLSGNRKWLMPMQYALPIISLEPLTGQWGQHIVRAYSGYNHMKQRGYHTQGRVSMLTPIQVPHEIPAWLIESRERLRVEFAQREERRRAEMLAKYPDSWRTQVWIDRRAYLRDRSGLGDAYGNDF